MIGSEATPDKNKISTGTLDYENIENEAHYEANSTGIGMGIGEGTKQNEKGITPNIGIETKRKEKSKTEASIAEGKVEIKDNPEQDLSDLNRDAEGSLNALGKIFDKEEVKEQQELAKLFGELAYEEAHKIGEKMGWKEGSEEKTILHAAIGGIMAKLGGGEFASGAIGAGLNEALQAELAKIKDPALHQWASAIIGAAAAKAAGESAQAGASTAASATKNNFLHFFAKPIIDQLDLDALEPNQVYVILLNVDGKIAGASGGVIVDKDGNVYDTAGVSIGSKFSASTPISGTCVIGEILDFNPKEKSVQQRIEGNSAGLSLDFGAHVGLSFSFEFGTKDENGKQSVVEITPATVDMGGSLISFGVSGSIGKTWEVGNRNDEDTWNPAKKEYSMVVNDYLENHSNEGIQIFWDASSKQTVLRRDGAYGVEQLTVMGGKPKWYPVIQDVTPPDWWTQMN